LLGITKIYEVAYSRRLDFFNEAILLVTSYHLFCFTDFVPKAATRYLVGDSLIYLIYITIVINLTGVARPFVLNIKNRVRRMRLRNLQKKYQKAMRERELQKAAKYKQLVELEEKKLVKREKKQLEK
jgi:hypothetical protein